MITQLLWWTGNALLFLILVRSFTKGFLGKYRLLFSYVGYVLLRSLVSFYLYAFQPGAYQFFYWYTEFLTICLGYCVIWEIYMQVLAGYAGVARMARAILTAVFLGVIGKVLITRRGGSFWPLNQTAVELERDLRTVQAVLFLVIVGLLLYYSIPVGRNLRGILSGYALYIGISLVQLSLRAHLGDNFQPWWHYLEPLAYDVTLAIWCVGLWSYAPNPTLAQEPALEQDYELLVSQATSFLLRMRNYIVRAVRS